MADKREQILVRIQEIMVEAKTGAGILTSVRNRGALPNDKRPATVLLDGDEREANVTPFTRADQYGGTRPRLMRMLPELYVIMDEGRPTGLTADAINLGTLLNEKRIKLSNAICNDAALIALLGPNGGIFYNGCVTDLKSGSALTGQMRLDFAYNYFFDPTAS